MCLALSSSRLPGHFIFLILSLYFFSVIGVSAFDVPNFRDTMGKFDLDKFLQFENAPSISAARTFVLVPVITAIGGILAGIATTIIMYFLYTSSPAWFK
jgi:hypothetical protein